LTLGLSFIVAVGLVLSGAVTHAVNPVSEESVAPRETTSESSNSLNLESHKGKVVYLDFWASWCAPCRKSFPWMNAMHKKYAEDGLLVIGVNVDRDEKAAQKFLKKTPADFSIVYDPEGKLASQYKLEAMPSSFLFGRDGQLQDSHLGFRDGDGDRLEKMIVSLLHQQDGADAKKTD
jgi:thiol-disulfide isomerase/thioredoxin